MHGNDWILWVLGLVYIWVSLLSRWAMSDAITGLLKDVRELRRELHAYITKVGEVPCNDPACPWCPRPVLAGRP